jgi:hypothetical protein
MRLRLHRFHDVWPAKFDFLGCGSFQRHGWKPNLKHGVSSLFVGRLECTAAMRTIFPRTISIFFAPLSGLRAGRCLHVEKPAGAEHPAVTLKGN